MKIKRKIPIIFIILFLAAATSCTTLKIGIDLLLLDFDGSELIENEPQVRNTLEVIMLTPTEYTMTAYTRRVFTPELKRTRFRYHSFYVLTGNNTLYKTLSFSGTKKRMRSIGVWVINTERDLNSYNSYKYGTNEWEVKEIKVDKGINTKMTIENILYRMDNNINYFYNDHKNDKKDMENCNTALENTLVENS